MRTSTPRLASPAPSTALPSLVHHLVPSVLLPTSRTTQSPSRSTRTQADDSTLSSSASSRFARSAADSEGSAHLPPGALVLDNRTFVDRRPPRKVGYLEAWWIWYQGTFVSSMLETWEFLLIHLALLLLVLLLSVALSYLPQHATVIAARAKYYFSGVGAEKWVGA
ncbi:hypothetical protein JCM8097_001657 [Rhodosporidiobolus ruineniae]